MINYSKDFLLYKERQKRIALAYEQILNEFSEYKIFGVKPSDSKELAVLLYYLLKDYELFHERV